MSLHFNWKTPWPHALPDVAEIANTTEDPKAVTCEACRWALGSQKQDSPVDPEDDLEERLLTILDICVGWTRPLTDAEKVEHIKGVAELALEELRGNGLPSRAD